MTEIRIDASDLQRLTADLGAVADTAQENLLPAVEHTALQIKDAWNGRLYSEGAAKRTGRAITYEITEGVLGIGADIGARRGSGRQAGIVRLLENGSIHNAPHGAGAASLREAEEDFQQRLAFALYLGLDDNGLT